MTFTQSIGDLRRKFPSFNTIEELQEFYISCELSRLVYFPQIEIPKKLEEVAQNPWFTIESHQITLPKAPQKLIFAKDKNKLYVSLCGTQSWSDWAVDLSTSLKSFPLLPGTLIHQGFTRTSSYYFCFSFHLF